jgi:hypothetical protein
LQDDLSGDFELINLCFYAKGELTDQVRFGCFIDFPGYCILTPTEQTKKLFAAGVILIEVRCNEADKKEALDFVLKVCMTMTEFFVVSKKHLAQDFWYIACITQRPDSTQLGIMTGTFSNCLEVFERCRVNNCYLLLFLLDDCDFSLAVKFASAFTVFWIHSRSHGNYPKVCCVRFTFLELIDSPPSRFRHFSALDYVSW